MIELKKKPQHYLRVSRLEVMELMLKFKSVLDFGEVKRISIVNTDENNWEIGTNAGLEK